MHKAWQSVFKEKDVVEIFRSLRYLKTVVKLHVVTAKRQRKQLKQASQFKIIDLSPPSSPETQSKSPSKDPRPARTPLMELGDSVASHAEQAAFTPPSLAHTNIVI